MSQPRQGDIARLTSEIRQFARERDWEQFHDPKSLVLALVGEVGELAELFQWAKADEAGLLFSSGKHQRRAAEEIADVATYLIRLADILNIDLAEAVAGKLSETRRRYPAGDVIGQAPSRLNKTPE